MWHEIEMFTIIMEVDRLWLAIREKKAKIDLK